MSHNFIDLKSVTRLKVELTRMNEPVKVFNVDSLKNVAGIVNSYAMILVKIGQDLRQLRFYVAKLGKDQVILGYPFLRAFNPIINWRMGKIEQEKGIILSQRQKRKIMIKRLQLTVLKQCGILLSGHAIYMRRISFAQQWMAAGEKSHDHLTKTTLPPEYQHYESVFDQNLAAHSPPLQVEDFSI